MWDLIKKIPFHIHLIVFGIFVIIILYLFYKPFETLIDSTKDAYKNKKGMSDLNIIIDTDKVFTKTRLEIVSSTCKPNNDNNKNFTCSYIEDKKHNLIFKGDDNYSYEDEININKDTNSYTIPIIEDKDIILRNINFELLADRKLKGQLSFNKLKNKSYNTIQIEDNNISSVRNKTKIDFEIDNYWDTVVNPNRGLFLNIQVDNKNFSDLPKFHYSRDTGKIFVVRKEFNITAKRNELNDFFIHFFIFNLERDNILVLKNNDRRLIRISSSKAEQRLRRNIVKADGVTYNNNSYEVEFKRVLNVETNRYNCEYKITNQSVVNANPIFDNFDCTYEFGTNFTISSDSNRYNFIIGELITGKNRENDFSLFNSSRLNISTTPQLRR